MKNLILCILIFSFSIHGCFSGTGGGSGTKNSNSTPPVVVVSNTTTPNLINWNYTIAPLVNATNSTFQTRPAYSDPSGVINAPVPDNVIALGTYPNFPGSVILSKPTDTDMTFNVVPNVILDFYQVVVMDIVFKYSDNIAHPNVNESTEVTIYNLSPNTKYYYYLQYSVGVKKSTSYFSNS